MTNNPTDDGRERHLGPAQEEALREFTGVANALVTRIRSVSEQVESELATVTTRMDWLLAKSRRFRIGFRVLYGLTALVLGAAIVLGVVAVNMAGTQSKLTKSDAIQTQDALCPLYALFIQADTPQARERAARQGTSPEMRKQQFDTIRESYRVLGCTPGLNPDGTVPQGPATGK